MQSLISRITVYSGNIAIDCDSEGVNYARGRQLGD